MRRPARTLAARDHGTRWGPCVAPGASVGALVVAVAVSGCGAASEKYEVAGIDELVIPTPTPDPGDFVATIDNPWLPLCRGSTWTYEVTPGVDDYTLTRRGHRRDGDGRGSRHDRRGVHDDADDTAATVRDFYAQDRDGNVWWFGSEGVWEAGVDGAQAGLAMPADPRVGDGWRLGLLDGVVEDRATVENVEDGQVILRVESDLTPGTVVQRTYDDGVGLVRTFTLEGPPGSSELTSGP